ncbi:MAG: rod shape-determining protein MreD [Eubacterium sp.]|nr:rod shape-determining protein MreD [Eubacterium sp.]
MNLSKRDLTIKYTLYCVILAAAALLQNVHGLWFQIGGARCFFVVPAVVLLSLGEDERVAAFMGLFAGFLWDCVSSAHMGFNGILLMLLCYIAATIVNFLLRNTFWVAVVSAIICTFIYCIFYWLFIVLPHGGDGAVLSLFYFYLPSFFYTAAVGFVLGVAFSPLKKKLNKGIIE